MNVRRHRSGAAVAMTTSLLLVVADGASEAAQRVFRCGPDGRTYSQTPCSDGYEIDTDDMRTAEQRKAAAAVLKRDAKLADQMTRERLAKEAAAASDRQAHRKQPSRPRRPHRPLQRRSARRPSPRSPEARLHSVECPHGSVRRPISAGNGRSLQRQVLRVAAGGTRQGLMLGRSALCADSAAVLGLGSRRTTRYVRCAHCAQTAAASQSTKRAARADPSPVLLAAPQIAPAGYRLPRRPPGVVLAARNHHWLRKGAPGQVAARLRGAEEHRSCGPRAQRAS